MEKIQDLMTIDRSMLLEVMSDWDLSLEKSFIEISNALPICPFLSDLAQKMTFDLPMQVNACIEKNNIPKLLELMSCYRQLIIFDDAFIRMWGWGWVYDCLLVSDEMIRIMAISCLEKLLNLDQNERNILAKQVLKVESLQDLEFFEVETAFKIEKKRSDLINQTLSKSSHSNLTVHDGKVVNLSGVLLPYPRTDYKSRLIQIKSVSETIYEIALCISLKLPVLLQGPSGSGKSFFIQEIANITGKQLLKIHLGDQTDSKMLLGSYICTATPGVFKWQPGVLTVAVSQGCWILIEDIDKAPIEITSVLLPLLESRKLFIPGRAETIMAKSEFRIFGTQSFLPDSPSQQVGYSLWKKIPVSSYENEDLSYIIDQRFPELQFLTGVLVNSYSKAVEILKNQHKGNRTLNMRDLIKWCERINYSNQQKMSNQQLLESIFLDAVDCFSNTISNDILRCEFNIILGECLEVPQHRVEFYTQNYSPEIFKTDRDLKIGRSSCEIVKANNHRSRATFATTTQSSILLEKLLRCVTMNEPVLLVGETGTGKTSTIQYLASELGRKLVVFNLSQQSDSSDLIGGFKPVDIRVLANPLREMFLDLFGQTFSLTSNESFLSSIDKSYKSKKWKHFVTGLRNAINMASSVFEKARKTLSAKREDEISPAKKQKRNLDSELESKWLVFEKSVNQFEIQREQIKDNLLFSFVEGALIRAIKEGHWVLLDEINLATSETLDCLNGLLQDSESSLIILERGDTHAVARHENFRIFGCMNPANDAGKRELPTLLRNRFSEFWVDSPDSNISDLQKIINQYLKDYLPHGTEGSHLCMDITEFHLDARKYANEGQIYDGAEQRIHFSVRTLTRALNYSIQIIAVYGLRRSLYEGICMSYLTSLNLNSYSKMTNLIKSKVLNNIKNQHYLISQIPKCPSNLNSNFSLIGSFWIENGLSEVVEEDPLFIMTPSVEVNLKNLARTVLARKYPVLIQGPTSVGKTSIIEYLARRTGHRFVRINNHEHTDIQEYIGNYTSNDKGQMLFKEGILVEALRKGYWIVLDELNLAPSDVLEALNRLLDDNREIFIPETQETIRPHKNFMLFATQNPVGQYGGRKQLSRAFRNRFLELHFSDIPSDELETILSKRCKIAPSYAKKLVNVYKILQKSRGNSRIFDGSFGFITLRDMFRWALREASNYQQLAENGYMILAERMRTAEDRFTVQQVLEKELKVSIFPSEMYNLMWSSISDKLRVKLYDHLFNEIVWTQAMKKLFVLSYNCLQYSEPILLVGETGCGKTTICQLLASLAERKLHIVNAHQHSETSDFIGSQRPCRNRQLLSHEIMQLLTEIAQDMQLRFFEKLGPVPLLQVIETSIKTMNGNIDSDILLKWEKVQALYTRSKILFEWADGPLIEAMKGGDFFLLDEISLADDSVLERLNSVLEPSRLIVLAEKGDGKIHEIYANPDFRFFATMNPGGDYGKKELSPALRNRFTEIWVSSISDESDIALIIQKKIESISGLEDQSWNTKILSFYSWISNQIQKDLHEIISLRDILSWIEFMFVTSPKVGASFAFLNGALMTIVDGLKMNPLIGVTSGIESLKKGCIDFLFTLSGAEPSQMSGIVATDGENFGIHPFYICKGPLVCSNVPFSFSAPTTFENTFRILRAMQLSKSILMEGSPGVGKTSLILSLAALTGNNVVRINLSEQTDLMDLLGTDLPVEDGSSGQFAWHDGPLLQALQDGSWVLLDELNLASQQVLEGLNSCLDHRATIYIPELGKSFEKHPNFRLFGAQNPQQQGGGRKGLPKSFMNRFTLVYLSELNYQDLLIVCKDIYGKNIPDIVLQSMIKFVEILSRETSENISFGWLGSPWEFNLRDVMRWADLICREDEISLQTPFKFFNMLFSHRFRSYEDRNAVKKLYAGIFQTCSAYDDPDLSITVDQNHIKVGMAKVETKVRNRMSKNMALLPSTLPFLESIAKSIEMGWMPLIIGRSGSGKTILLRYFAELCGERLVEFSMNAGVDAIELLGGFEQEDISRIAHTIKEIASSLAFNILKSSIFQNGVFSLSQDKKSLLIQIHKEILDLERFFAESYHILKQLATELGSGECMELCSELDSLYIQFRALKNNAGPGKFKWMDGLLINAMRKGQWIVIDNVNLCSKSVIDRLNSLLEKNGSLMINERGLVNGKIDVVSPHEKFRIFMTMDPTQGEISRAMRNRSVEIFLDSFDSIAKSVDSIKMIGSVGVRSLGSDNINEVNVSDGLNEIENSKLFLEEVERGLAHDHGRFSISKGLAGEFIPSLEYSGLHPTNLHMVSDSHILTKLIFSQKFMKAYNSHSFLDQYIASSSSILREAIHFFSKTSTAEEIELRIKWLTFLFNFTQYAAAKESSLVSKMDFQYLKATSLSLYKFSKTSAWTYPNFQKACIMLESLGLCTEPSKHGLVLKDRSLISQSALFHLGKIAFSDLKHPSIKSLYPLLRLILNSICKLTSNSLINDQIIGCAIAAIEPLYLFSFTSHFSLAGMVARIHAIRKSWIHNFSQFNENEELLKANNLLNEICISLQLDQIYIHSKVVGKLRSESLKFEELYKIQEALTNYDNYIQEILFAQLDLSTVLRNATMVEVRKTIVEAHATLYYLNEFNSLDRNVLEKLKTLLKSIEARVDKKKVNTAISGSIAELLNLSDFGRTVSKMVAQDSIIIRKELELITTLCKFAQSNESPSRSLLGVIKSLIEGGLNSSRSCTSLLMLQRLLWRLESDSEDILGSQAVENITSSWFMFVFQNSYTNFSNVNDFNESVFNGFKLEKVPQAKFGGPLSFCSALLTQHIAKLINTFHSAPIYTLANKLNNLEEMKPLIASNGYDSSIAYDNLFKVLMFKIIKILNIIQKVLGSTLRAASLSIHEKTLAENSHTIYQNIQDILQNIKDVKFSSSFLEKICYNHAVPSLSYVSDFVLKNDSKSLGFAFVQISLAELDICLLEIAVDPYEYSLAKLDITAGKEELINSKIIVESEMSLWKFGKLPKLESILSERQKLKSKISDKSKQKVLRPLKSEVAEILQDFANLRQLVLSNLDIYTQIYEMDDPLSKVTYLDQSLTSFADRLNNRYPLYRDITGPVSGSVSFLKCGLFLMIKDQLMVSPRAVKLLSYLHKFIGFGDHELFCKLLSDAFHSDFFSKEDKLESCVFTLVMSALNFSGNSLYQSQRMNIILGYLSNISLAWKENTEWHSKENRAKDDLYRYKSETYEDQTIDSEDEQVAVYFPDYYSAFENDSPKNSSQDSYIIPDSTVLRIIEAHNMVFSSNYKSCLKIFQDNWETNFREGYGIGARLISNSPNHYPIEVDTSSQTASLFMASWYSQNSFSEELYDFYSTPDVEEANVLIASVGKFAARISTLLNEFPEHNVLQHLNRLCEKIFRLPIETPIMKLLSGIELLLQKAQDWESYAHKNISLSIEISDISSCIVRLRKKELYSWKDLFALERRKSSVKAAKLWVNLWDMIIVPLLNPMSEEENIIFLNELRDLIDVFMMNSSLGEFSTRLQMVESFAKQIQCMIYSQYVFISGSSNDLCNILKNMVSFFSSFKPLLLEYLTNQEKPLVTDLNEFIKISSWKDINAYALKESAKRSHYQLVKFIKKYRTILDSPARQVIKNMLDKNDLKIIESQILEEISNTTKDRSVMKLSAGSSLEEMSKRKGQIHSIISKIGEIAGTFVSNSSLNASAQRFDSFTCNLLKDVQMFKSESLNIKSGSKEASFEKSLRKKALSDWIKEISNLGISKRPSVEYQRAKDMLFLFSSPSLQDVNVHYLPKHANQLLAKVDRYFFQVLGKMSSMSESISKSKGDLSEREITTCASFIEHLWFVIVRLRGWISAHGDSVSKIGLLLEQIKSYNSQKVSSVLKASLSDTHALLESVSQSLKVIIQAKVFCKFSNDAKSNEWSELLTKNYEILETYNQKLQEYLLPHIMSSNELFISPVSYKALKDEYKQIVESTILSMKDSSPSSHQRKEVMDELLKNLNNVSEVEHGGVPALGNNDVCYTDMMIDRILLSFQSILKVSENYVSDPDIDNYGMQEKEFSNSLNIAEEYADNENLIQVLDLAQKAIKDSREDEILLVSPFLTHLRNISEIQIIDLLFFTLKISKLAYVGASIFDTILKEGFCVPEGEEASGGDGEEKEASGVGLGDGTGEKDISKEIETEGEIEELQSDSNAQSKPENTEQNDNAIEAKDDFDGELEDVNENGSDDMNDEPKNDEDNGPELDEQMGDVDDNADVVDEKLWNGEEEEQKDEKVEKDAPVSGSPDEELVAQMEEQNSKETSKGDLKDQESENPNELIESDDDENLHDQEMEDNAGVDIRPDEYFEMKDSNIPEDMEFSSDLEIGDDEENKSDKSDQDPNLAENESGQDEEYPETEDIGDEIHDEIDENQQDVTDQLDQNPDNEINSINDETHIEDAQQIEQNDNLHDNTKFGTQGSNAQVEFDEENISKNDDKVPLENLENADEDMGDQPNSGKKSSDENVSKNSELNQNEPNPRRSLGEALKSWMKRLQNVSEASPDASHERENNDHQFDETREYEFLVNDDLAADTEALDIATQEQLDAIDGKAIADLEMQQQYAEMRKDDREKSSEADDKKTENLRKENGDLNDSSHQIDQFNESNIADNMESEPNTEENKINDSLEVRAGQNNAMEIETGAPEPLDIAILDSDQRSYDELRHELEMELVEWRKGGQEFSEAQKIWKECLVLTRNLSYNLCEKLRLILEPTLASKLRGDYRTGKRLNMRKIIPYIASQFKKDKIWLRRTQPSKRTYQIMIAVDDSKSMEESQCIQLAYESLAMITSSLTQLEAGDISILSFGESIKLLHPFHLPFSQESGAQVIQNFSFNQDRTNVKSLISNSCSILEEARRFAEYSPNQSELWQLELIISDGICEDHDQIRSLVRKAAENRIMVVFLILDNRPGTTSITKLTNVVYKNDPETQKSTLHMTQYMDTFPFDYFVLVKDIKTLPQVLSDTLCQYFAFTASV